MPTLRTIFGWLLGVAIFCPAATAAAQPASTAPEKAAWARVRLVQQGPLPVDCPQPAELTKMVEDILGRPVFVARRAPEATVQVDYRIAPHQNGWNVHFALKSVEGPPLGTREVTSSNPNCAELDDRLALVLALLVDLPRERIEVTLPAPPTGSLERIGFSLNVVGHLGGLPAFTWGIRAAERLKLTSIPSIEVGLTGWPPQQVGREGLEFMLSGWALDASVCPELVEAFGFEACGGLQGGLWQSQGEGFSVDLRDTAGLLVAELWGALVWDLVPWLALRGAVGTRWMIVRPTATASSTKSGRLSVATSDVLQPAAQFGMLIRLPR